MSEFVDRVLNAMLSRGLNANETDALAVIKAIREPTDAMFMAGSNAAPYISGGPARRRNGRIGDMPARDCWRLMIDQVLSEVAWSEKWQMR